jgi:PAS domain S-box-containing protein
MSDSHDEGRSSADELLSLRQRVAELERGNAQLRASLSAGDRERYDDLVENMNDIIYTTNLEGVLMSVNRAVKRVLGFEPQEVIGTHYGRWMSPADFARLEATRPGTLRGQRVTNQAVLRDKGGQEHHVEISVAPLVRDGRVEGTQGVIRDVTHQRKVEQAVRESEEMLRSLFNAATESILLLDREGTVLALNETAARRFGKSPDELIGTKIADADQFPPAVAEYRTRRISEVLYTKKPVRFEDERAGRCFDTSAYPVCDPQGNVREIAIFGKDVTERKRAEEEITKLQRRIEFILGAAKTNLNITDQDFNLRLVDANWRRIYGDYQGRKCYEYFHKADQPCPGCGIPKALETHGIVTYDATLPWEGDRPIQVTTIPFQDESGAWLAAEVNVDIAERKQLERKLQESEARYRTVVESAGEAMAVVDVHGVFQFMNGTAARALGGRPEDFVGKSMPELFPPEIADRQMRTVRRVIETVQGANVIVPSIAGDRLRWYNTTIEPLTDGAGATTAALVIARDIHDLRMAQQELEVYREKMFRAEHLASLGTLGAVLSHEMTQPLTVIRLSIQNALKTLESLPAVPTVLEDLNEGLAEISTVAAIVQRFRDFAGRTSDGTVAEVSLAAVAHRVFRLLEESARTARITLKADRLEELPPLRTCGKDIEQVFFALAQNAIQAAGGSRDCHFRISGTLQDKEVQLQFADNCGGIASGVLEHILEPFFTTKPPGQGTGLGLCMVQGIVSRLGGHLKVDSRWGEGTSFLITLPVEAR